MISSCTATTSFTDRASITLKDDRNIFFKTGDTERVRIDSSGRLLVGTTTEGHADADNLTISDSGKTGITIRNTSATGDGAIFFSDATSGAGEYAGYVEYGHNSDYLRFATTGTERLRIDSSGRLLVGTTSARTTLNTPQILTESVQTGTGNRGISIINGGNAESAPILNFGKHRSASIGGSTIAQNDDYTGAIAFNGSDGTNFIQSALITARVDGTPGTDDMPGRLEFSTTPDGSATPTERMRINSLGQFKYTLSDYNAEFFIHSTPTTAGALVTLIRGWNYKHKRHDN